MLSLARIALFTVSLAALACNLRVVNGSPLPMPVALSLESRKLDSPGKPLALRGSARSSPRLESSLTSTSIIEKRTPNDDSAYASIRAYSNQANASSRRFSKYCNHCVRQLLSFIYAEDLASRSASVDDDNFDYQQECAQALGEYQETYSGLKGLLAQLGSDKGLKNYDGEDPVQVLLKDVVNAHKDILHSVSVIVNNLPILGPILGPSESSSSYSNTIHTDTTCSCL
jgi:hypothetical protein